MRTHSTHIGIYYLLAASLLSLYGTEVCPLVEGIGVGGVLPIFVLAFGLVFVFRSFAFPKYKNNPSTGVRREFLLWVFVAVFVGTANALIFDVALGSAPKIALGCLALGLPLSSYYGLLLERDDILRAREADVRTHPQGPKRSIPTHVYQSNLLSQMLLALVVGLLILKDFGYLNRLNVDDINALLNHAAFEILVSFSVLLLANAFVAYLYSKNLELLLTQQLERMDAVAQGNLDVFVPVVSNHELARIGDRANAMIETLKQRERVKSLFGKLVSPQVAQTLLAEVETDVLGGREVNAVVLFTDIRDFTAISETYSPSDVVTLLNEYFTMLVDVVHTRGGVLDKFIGDAAMAVFGLDDLDNPATANNAAFQTAQEIRNRLTVVNASLTSRGLPTIEHGFGIHYGRMVAGNIGSLDRLEYTVIGDAVNVASRLEGLCKDTGSWLSVSAESYTHLSTANRAKLECLGEFEIKGKQQPVNVYGPT